MELQGRQEALAAAGIGLAAITYDSPATLKAFADRMGIRFPLLSDAGSAVIRRYGLLNPDYAEGHKYFGIPFPGTFVLDASGLITARHFESDYRERTTVARLAVGQSDLFAKLRGKGTPYSTRHLDAVGSVSDETVAIGQRFTLVLDITPVAGMHIYAPPQTEYRALDLAVTPLPNTRLHRLSYPKSETYEFKPLNETVQVYMKPFRLVQDVTLEVNDATRKLAAAAGASLTFTGTLAYQACDDSLCFPPDELKVSWTIGVKGLAR